MIRKNSFTNFERKHFSLKNFLKSSSSTSFHGNYSHSTFFYQISSSSLLDTELSIQKQIFSFSMMFNDEIGSLEGERKIFSFSPSNVCENVKVTCAFFPQLYQRVREFFSFLIWSLLMWMKNGYYRRPPTIAIWGKNLQLLTPTRG